MNATALIDTLEHNAAKIAALVHGMSRQQALYSPDPAKWSTIEVMRHLVDEETEDFRTRLDLTLHHPDTEWPAIDPEGWVTARNYREADLQTTVAEFLSRRRDSVQWLRPLQSPDWSIQRDHPQFGAFSAGDLFLSWVAHDQLHMRQLLRLQYQYAATLAPNASSRYAGGEW